MNLYAPKFFLYQDFERTNDHVRLQILPSQSSERPIYTLPNSSYSELGMTDSLCLRVLPNQSK